MCFTRLVVSFSDVIEHITLFIFAEKKEHFVSDEEAKIHVLDVFPVFAVKYTCN